MAAPGLELESITHQSVQSIKALSHIRGSNRQVDPGRRSDSKHGSPYKELQVSIWAPEKRENGRYPSPPRVRIPSESTNEGVEGMQIGGVELHLNQDWKEPGY
jgi:hypothetical protein